VLKKNDENISREDIDVVRRLGKKKINIVRFTSRKIRNSIHKETKKC